MTRVVFSLRAIWMFATNACKSAFSDLLMFAKKKTFGYKK